MRLEHCGTIGNTGGSEWNMINAVWARFLDFRLGGGERIPIALFPVLAENAWSGRGAKNILTLGPEILYLKHVGTI